MKRSISIIMSLIIVAAIFSACDDNNNGNNQEPDSETTTVSEPNIQLTAKNIFEESFRSHDFNGAAYMVYKGEEIYSGGSGKANKKENIDNDADTVYHIASVTKQFTAAAILKLCEQKKISLDDTLQKYYPDYLAGADITIHNLLSMQSGIPNFTVEYDENGNEKESESQITIDGVTEDNTAEENRDAIKAWIFSQKLLFSQGERFSYSNSNYFLLGGIIEQASGQTYFDYLKTNFFIPYEMKTAGFDENYDISEAKVAKGYHYTGITSEIYGYKGVAFASGDMMASPKDLYQWSVALHGGKVLSSEMYQKMTKEYAKRGDGTSYGYGLMIVDDSGGKIYFHNGATPRFFSYVIYSPKKDLFLAVMSNYASETILTVTKEVSEKVLKEIE